MYKRKKEINALNLLKEINEYKKSRELGNIKDKYNTKTLNIKNNDKNYNTKTLKTCITSYNELTMKEIKKKKYKGRLDLGSHRNKDIFLEVDSEQYDSGDNPKSSYKKNKCSKLLIDKITPCISEHYLTQNNINPYYSIKTYNNNNYNIKNPFNYDKKRNNKNKNIFNNDNNNNKISNSSNEIIKYPYIISLTNKNNTHKQQISNLSNYINDKPNDYFYTLSDDSNITEDKNKNRNSNIKSNNNNIYNSEFNDENPINNNNEEIEPDFKMLYLIKEQELNDLLNDYNILQNELKKYKKNNNNYMINNFKKLKNNKINNNKQNKQNKNIKVVNDINIFYEKEKNINQIFKINQEYFNILSKKENNNIKYNNNENIKIFNEIKFELIKTFKNKNILIPLNTNKIEIESKVNILNQKYNKNKNIITRENNLEINSKYSNFHKNECFSKDLIINKINSFKIEINNRTNRMINLKKENNININLKPINKVDNKKLLEYNEIKEKEDSLINKENNISNNISIDLNDILDEINIRNSNPENKNKSILLKGKDKKFNLNKFINKNIDKDKENNEKNISDNNNNNALKKQNHLKIEDKDFMNGKSVNLPDLSYIRNKLHISIVKRKKINEDELL